jgi:hypothetical protein
MNLDKKRKKKKRKKNKPVLGPIFSRPSHFSPPRQPTAPCRSHRPVGPTSQQPQPESARVYPCHGHMGPAPSAALFAARITHPGYSRLLPIIARRAPLSRVFSQLWVRTNSNKPRWIFAKVVAVVLHSIGLCHGTIKT